MDNVLISTENAQKFPLAAVGFKAVIHDPLGIVIQLPRVLIVPWLVTDPATPHIL